MKLLQNGKYQISNPIGSITSIQSDGVVDSRGVHLYYHANFETTFYEDINSNRVNLLFNAYPPISELLNQILNKPEKSIKLTALKYENNHEFAYLFFNSANDFIQNNEIENAHLCKKHLINIWKNC